MSQVWTHPAPMTPQEAFRFCARRALITHRAGQVDACRFWLDRAETFARKMR